MKKKIISVVEKKGFILILFICVCFVSAGTIYVSTKSSNIARENANREDVSMIDEESTNVDSVQDEYSMFENVSDIEIGFHDGYKNEDQIISQVDEEQAVDENEDLEEEAIEVMANEAELEPQVQPELEEKNEADFVEEIVASFMPVDGKIITEYTKDALVYSDTLESWVGHSGIDIKADEGSVVKSIAGGTVKEVYTDELWGIVIVIDHGNGLETKYANLGTDKMVEKGLRVEKGDHISKIGKTAKIEMHLEPHLHFEVKKDGKLIDPCSIVD